MNDANEGKEIEIDLPNQVFTLVYYMYVCMYTLVYVYVVP